MRSAHARLERLEQTTRRMWPQDDTTRRQRAFAASLSDDDLDLACEAAEHLEAGDPWEDLPLETRARLEAARERFEAQAERA